MSGNSHKRTFNPLAESSKYGQKLASTFPEAPPSAIIEARLKSHLGNDG